MEKSVARTDRRLQAFLIALGVAAAFFIPFVIMDRGYFTYYGDFNVQQIPFYKLAHEAVRSGDIFWSWYTDLGANFIGSYSFYLLLSPFFWLTLPFPTEWLPFMMAPLLVLKTACSSLTAYLYLQRMVKDTGYALIGALLYAFSGWMTFNIFFNHFHEVAVFFPLLLLGVEKLVVEDKKGLFALAVTVNAMVNYWFFVGEVVFVILYVLVRMTDKSWPMTVKKFIQLALEAILGVGMSLVVLLPSVLSLMGNPRTGTSKLLQGWGLWLYSHEQRVPAILASLFYPPEIVSLPNFFPDHGAKWASLSGWLPFASMAGVLAYCHDKKKDWLKNILVICLLFAVVPGLNALFVLMNDSYYARWFYMPILLMCLATARALEDNLKDTAAMRSGVIKTAIAVLVVAVMCAFTPVVTDSKLAFGLAKYPITMWVYIAVSVISVVAFGVITLRYSHSPRYRQGVTGGVVAITLIFTIFYMASGRSRWEPNDVIITTAIQGREKIDLPQDTFARADAYKTTDNLMMYWHLPALQTFHSVVPVSIMEFYPAVGVTRDVGSRPDEDAYALRPLLSVRWLFIEQDEEEQNPMAGYSKYAEQAGYNIYENDNFIPMGFAYDKYIDSKSAKDVSKDILGNAMLTAVVLEKDSVARNSDILTQLKPEQFPSFDAWQMTQDVAQRGTYTVDDFAHDRLGFSAKSNFNEDKFIFFSVPWEKGWSASINGKPVHIEKANIGFMAVRVPAGSANIRFDYMTPGLKLGGAFSGVFLVIFLGYLLLMKKTTDKDKQELDVQRALFMGETVNLTWEQYIAHSKQGKERADKLQQTFNQAATVHIKEELEPEERTLHFNPAPIVDDEQTGEDEQEEKP